MHRTAAVLEIVVAWSFAQGGRQGKAVEPAGEETGMRYLCGLAQKLLSSFVKDIAQFCTKHADRRSL